MWLFTTQNKYLKIYSDHFKLEVIFNSLNSFCICTHKTHKMRCTIFPQLIFLMLTKITNNTKWTNLLNLFLVDDASQRRRHKILSWSLDIWHDRRRISSTRSQRNVQTWSFGFGFFHSSFSWRGRRRWKNCRLIIWLSRTKIISSSRISFSTGRWTQMKTGFRNDAVILIQVTGERFVFQTADSIQMKCELSKWRFSSFFIFSRFIISSFQTAVVRNKRISPIQTFFLLFFSLFVVVFSSGQIAAVDESSVWRWLCRFARSAASRFTRIIFSNILIKMRSKVWNFWFSNFSTFWRRRNFVIWTFWRNSVTRFCV